MIAKNTFDLLWSVNRLSEAIEGCPGLEEEDRLWLQSRLTEIAHRLYTDTELDLPPLSTGEGRGSDLLEQVRRRSLSHRRRSA